jgi:chorismate mutase/prephenate dehydrogenase
VDDTSPDRLDTLRNQLDVIDSQLLSLAAERLRVVGQIGRWKLAHKRPLFDREREQTLLTRVAESGRALGLEPDVARALIAVLVEASHHTQTHILKNKGGPSLRRHFLIVGGDGGMGRFFRRIIEDRGHDVSVFEKDSDADITSLVSKADVTVLAVPMNLVVDVARRIAPLVRPDALLCDINSLKGEICQVMGGVCRGEVLGLHPMFGPSTSSMRRQKVVCCTVRDGPIGQWVRQELGAMGAELIETKPETHDAMMAVVQVLIHFNTIVMGEALRRSGVSIESSLAFTSPIYRLELAFIGRLFAQSPELYREILMENPQGASVRKHFLEAAQDVENAVSQHDHGRYHALFSDAAEFFSDFSHSAMALSDHLIEALIARP